MAKAKTTPGTNYLGAATGALSLASDVVNNLTSTFEYTPQFKSSGGPLNYQQEESIDIAKQSGSGFGATLSGGAKGAAAMSATGPYGMIAGGVVGAGAALFNRDQQMKQMKRQNEGIKNRNLYRLAEAGSTQLRNDYNTTEQNAEMAYMSKGGKFLKKPTGKPNARVDHGETIMSRGGEVETVENSNPNTTEVQPNSTDGYVTTLENGDRILSNKTMIPGTNKTFADEGRKIESKLNSIRDKKKSGTSVDRNTMALNESNLMKQYNDLFEIQESLKGPKTSPEGSYKDGGEAQMNVGRTHIQYPMEKAPGINLLKNNHMQIPTAVAKGMRIGNMAAGAFGTVGDLAQLYNDVKDTESLQNSIKRGGKFGIDAAKELREKYKYNPENMPTITWSKGGQYKDLPGYYNGDEYDDNQQSYGSEIERMRASGELVDNYIPKERQLLNPKSQGYSKTDLRFKPVSQGEVRKMDVPTYAELSDGPEKSSLWSSMSDLAPSLMNIANSFGKKDTMGYKSAEDFVSQNPYEQQALDTLSKRKTNIQPLLRKNAENAAIARYNARQSGTGSRAYDLATLSSKTRADQDVMMQDQQMKNSMLSDYSNALSQFGSQRAQSLMQANAQATDYNLKARQTNNQIEANRQGLLNKGISDISQYGQMNKLTKKKDIMDERILRMMENYYNNFNNKPIFGKQ